MEIEKNSSEHPTFRILENLKEKNDFFKNFMKFSKKNYLMMQLFKICSLFSEILEGEISPTR